MNLNYIGFVNFKNNNYNKTSCAKYPNLKPLSYDCVSFTAMKKSQFKGIDLAVINKFQAPIEKFNSNSDLQDWCLDKINKLKEKDLDGRQQETTIQRKATFKEWTDYIQNENDAYNNAICLLILDGILSDIKNDNDKEIPVLNKGILAQTIDEINKEVKNNPKAQINFNKQYKLNLQKMSLDNLDNNLDSNQTGWVIIPSKENDPENFESNVDKLKTLSHHNWCTASFNAEPYLSEGDFHVYLENGKAKLGVRFVKDKIQEIQGEKNNSKIPIKYYNIAKSHVESNNYKLSYKTENEFRQARIIEREIKELEEKLKAKGVDFKTASTMQLFDAFGIKYEVDKDGLLIIEEYRQPNKNFTFDDIQIDENKLFKDIKKIKGNAYFSESKVTSLDNIEFLI